MCCIVSPCPCEGIKGVGSSLCQPNQKTVQKSKLPKRAANLSVGDLGSRGQLRVDFKGGRLMFLYLNADFLGGKRPRCELARLLLRPCMKVQVGLLAKPVS